MSVYISIREQIQEREIERLRLLLSRLCSAFEQHFPTMCGQVKGIQESLFTDFTANQIEMAAGYLNGNGPRGMAMRAAYGDAAEEMHHRELPVAYPTEGLEKLTAMLWRSFVKYVPGSQELLIGRGKQIDGELAASTRTSTVVASPEYAEASVTIGDLSSPTATGVAGYTIVLPFHPASEPRNRVVVLLPLGTLKPSYLVYVPLEGCWVNAGETNVCYADWTILLADAKQLIESVGLESTGIELGDAFEKIWPTVVSHNLPVVGISEQWLIEPSVNWYGERAEVKWYEAEFQHVQDGNVDALQLRTGFDVFTIARGVAQEGDASTIYRFNSAGGSFGLSWDLVPYQTRRCLIDVYMTTIAATAAARSETTASETPGRAGAWP